MMEDMNIIVRMPNWLGDFIMAMPVLKALKEQYPSSSITVMCTKALSDLLKDNKYVDNKIVFEKPRHFFSKESEELIQKLKKHRFDLGVLLTNSFSSAYYFWRAKISQRIGYVSHCRRVFLNVGVSFSRSKKNMHQVDLYKQLLTPLNISNIMDSPKIYLSNSDIDDAKKMLIDHGYDETKKLIGINPFAAYGPAKCWPKERYVSLAKKLLEDKDLFVVFVGDNKSKRYIGEMVKSLPTRAIDLSGKTDIVQLASVIKLCDLFVTNDSGPMHMAAALDTPLVAIFGSTCDVMTGPYNSDGVIHKRVSCYPCFKRVCNKDFSCMENIGVDEVLSIIKEKIYV